MGDENSIAFMKREKKKKGISLKIKPKPKKRKNNKHAKITQFSKKNTITKVVCKVSCRAK